MTDTRTRGSWLGIGHANADGSAVTEAVDIDGDPAAGIRDRETLSDVGDTTVDGTAIEKPVDGASETADDTLSRVQALMAEPPTAKSAR